jgi:prepilin-type N-terminal cleavage/methylation domain-containing protein
MHLTTSRPRTARPGFTLIEVMVVSVLMAIVGGAIVSMLGRQQRFYRGTSDIVELRSQLRQAAGSITGDLRGMSTVGGDLVTMTDSSMDFRYTIGSSMACVISGSTIILPPLTLASGNTLTSWLSKPVSGDTAYIFDEGATTTAGSDDSWAARTVSAVADNVGGCTSPYTTAADNASTSYTLSFASGTIPATVLRGAAIRFVRRAHYSLYHSSDGLWYLGYCSLVCNTVTNPIQAIAGPFRAYDPTTGASTSGIRITYFDVNGNTTATAASVARISIVLRGDTRNDVYIEGMQRGVYRDSVRINVAIRNRS